jgi:hypothetical protein
LSDKTSISSSEINEFLLPIFELISFRSDMAPRSLIYVPTFKVKNEKELDTYYDKWIEEGYEGQMIRYNSKYEFKRTWNLMKRKEWITEDFLILDIKEGEGNRSGMVGKFCFEKDGKPFDANPRGGFAKYTKWLQDKDKLINKVKATVRYQNLTPDGKPRFPGVIAIRDYE